MAPRLSGQLSKSFLGIEGQKKLEKFARFTRKPWSHARILVYQTWPIVLLALPLVLLDPLVFLLHHYHHLVLLTPLPPPPPHQSCDLMPPGMVWPGYIKNMARDLIH